MGAARRGVAGVIKWRLPAEHFRLIAVYGLMLLLQRQINTAARFIHKLEKAPRLFQASAQTGKVCLLLKVVATYITYHQKLRIKE